MTSTDNSCNKKIIFPAKVTISKRRYRLKDGRTKNGEHWYITIPTSVRKIISEDKTLNVTLERIV